MAYPFDPIGLADYAQARHRERIKEAEMERLANQLLAGRPSVAARLSAQIGSTVRTGLARLVTGNRPSDEPVDEASQEASSIACQHPRNARRSARTLWPHARARGRADAPSRTGSKTP